MSKRLLGYVGAMALGACLVAFGQDVAAQLMQFTDGTFGTKVAIFDMDGSAITLSSGRIPVLADINNGAAVTARNNSIVEGCVEHDLAGTACQPVQVGHIAIAHGTNPTEVAANDAVRGYANRAGIPFVIGGHPNIQTRECQVEDADGAQTGTACVTVSTGTKIVVTMVAAHCDGSTTNPTNIIVAFDTDGTFGSRAAGGLSGVLAGFDGVPAGGGMVKGSGAGIIGIGADDEDVRYTTEDPAGGNCSIEVTYYTVSS